MNEKKDCPYRFKYVPNTNKKEAALINEVERKMGGRLTESSLSEEQQVAFAAIRTLRISGWAMAGMTSPNTHSWTLSRPFSVETEVLSSYLPDPTPVSRNGESPPSAGLIGVPMLRSTLE